jgi:hypothetical protein
VPWHWLYFLYSGLGFALAAAGLLVNIKGFRPGGEGDAREDRLRREREIGAP